MITPAMKRKLDSLNIHPTPGENGWPQMMHVPNVRGLFRSGWLRHAFPNKSCKTRGCLVGHVGAAFHDGPYIAGTVPNWELGPAADDFMRLLLVRLGVEIDYLDRAEDRNCGAQIYLIASSLFESGILSEDEEGNATYGWNNGDGEDPQFSVPPPFSEIVEAWLDVTEYCHYIVTPALRRRMLAET